MIPNQWQLPLSDAERSIQRVMIGEWLWLSAAFDSMDAIAELADDAAWYERVVARLLAPFYQPRDTSNRKAAEFADTATRMDVPWLGVRAAVSALAQPDEGAPPRTLYNPVGRWLLYVGAPDYGSYGARLADLEGLRRAALATLELRAAQTARSEVAIALSKSALRSPYDGTAFTWDEQLGSVLFRGLESGERGEHRIEY